MRLGEDEKAALQALVEGRADGDVEADQLASRGIRVADGPEAENQREAA
jgi:hypothetical protein